MRMQIVCLAFTAVAVMGPLANSQPPATDPATPIAMAPPPIAVAPPVLQPAPVEWPAPPVWRVPLQLGQIPQISRMPTLNDLVLAKVDIGDDGSQVIMMIESYRTQKASVTVTKMVPETREREIEVNGKKETVKYTVHVAVTEEREMDTKAPAGRKPFKIAGDEIRFFNLAAEEVSIDEAGKILTSLSPIFLIDQNSSDPLPLPDICKRAMNEDCLIAVTKNQVRQVQHTGTTWLAPAIPALALPRVPIPPAQP